MNFRLSLVSLLCFSFGSALWADQIVMKNGDKVSGSIVKKDAKTLTIKSVHFGVITLPWADVASVTADAPIHVELPGGKTVEATLTTEGEKVAVKAGTEVQTVPAAEILTLRNADEQKAYERLLHPGFGDLWVLNGSFNLAGTAGNAKTSTVTTPVSASRVSNTSKTTVYFNFITADALVKGVSAATARAVRGGWAYNRNLTPRLFWNAFNDYEYDRFQSLDLRTVLGSGLGFGAWKGERGRLDLVGGAAWNREKFDPSPQPAFVRNSSEAYWGDDFAFKFSSRLSFIQGYRMFNNLTRTGEYRQNFDMGFTAKLTQWLTWNASASDRFLSNPAPGRKRNDFLYTTGFGFTMAR